MMDLKLWFRATRFHMVISGSSPIFVASAFAYFTYHVFNWFLFLLTWIAMTAVLISTDLFNDYFDYILGADNLNPVTTPFSGGSRVIQEKLISEKKIFYGSIVGLVFAALIGIYLNFVLDGITILLLGLTGFFLVYFYTAPPIKFCYRGLGEIAQAIGYGPVMIFGAYFVQTQVISFDIVLFSIPFTFIGLIVGMILSIPDYEADKKAKKNNLVIVLGKKRVIFLYGIMLFLIFLSDAILLYIQLIPLLSSVIFITAPLAIISFVNALKNINNTTLFLRTSKLTLLIAALHNYLFVISLTISSI
jgi:1,4-dihydroxy-2-naphthoate octaprenyltransferase